MTIKIILFSHSLDLAQATKKYLEAMVNENHEDKKLVALGGIENGKVLGTSIESLKDFIEKDEASHYLIFGDLGSAMTNLEVFKMMYQKKEIIISKGAFLENSFAAYVALKSGQDFLSIATQAQKIHQK